MTKVKILFFIIFILSTVLSSCSDSAPTSQGENAQKPQILSNSDPISSESTPSTSPAIDPVFARGQSLYKRCRTCHTLDKDGRHKVGPNLYGVFGATAGLKDGFNYSKTMKDSGVIWTDENLTAYIENPSKFMPGNRMSFVGLRKDEDIQNVLTYMKSQMVEE